MKGSNDFTKAIQTYLNGQAKRDDLFAKTLKKENKSIKECVNYIILEVQKTGNNAFSQEEIYRMAKHYYDEDDIKVGAAPSCNIVSPGNGNKNSRPKAKKIVYNDNQLSLFE